MIGFKRNTHINGQLRRELISPSPHLVALGVEDERIANKHAIAAWKRHNLVCHILSSHQSMSFDEVHSAVNRYHLRHKENLEDADTVAYALIRLAEAGIIVIAHE